MANHHPQNQYRARRLAFRRGAGEYGGRRIWRAIRDRFRPSDNTIPTQQTIAIALDLDPGTVSNGLKYGFLGMEMFYSILNMLNCPMGDLVWHHDCEQRRNIPIPDPTHDPLGPNVAGYVRAMERDGFAPSPAVLSLLRTPGSELWRALERLDATMGHPWDDALFARERVCDHTVAGPAAGDLARLCRNGGQFPGRDQITCSDGNLDFATNLRLVQTWRLAPAIPGQRSRVIVPSLNGYTLTLLGLLHEEAEKPPKLRPWAATTTEQIVGRTFAHRGDEILSAMRNLAVRDDDRAIYLCGLLQSWGAAFRAVCRDVDVLVKADALPFQLPIYLAALEDPSEPHDEGGR